MAELFGETLTREDLRRRPAEEVVAARVEQIRDLGYVKPPAVLREILHDLGITDAMIDGCSDELHYSLRDCSAGQG